MSIESKAQKDIIDIVKQINNHENKNSIVSVFMRGPPKNDGFMWCDKEGGPDKWWSIEEAEGLKFVSELVLNLGWDSSSYGIMLRKIQNEIKKQVLSTSPPVYRDDEGKYEGDPRNGLFSIYNN